jgi:hypothetical protein
MTQAVRQKRRNDKHLSSTTHHDAPAPTYFFRSK